MTGVPVTRGVGRRAVLVDVLVTVAVVGAVLAAVSLTVPVVVLVSVAVLRGRYTVERVGA